MAAGHWLGMIELFVAVGTDRFKIWKVMIEKWLARPLFSEPKHLKVHLFSMRQHCVVGFVIAWGVELAHKNRAPGVFF